MITTIQKLRKVVLGYYMIMPYLALIAVIVIQGKGAGVLIITGWMSLLIYQIFLMAVNQSPQHGNKPLYKQSHALGIPIVVLLNQIIFDGNIWLFFIEQMILELVVLLVGIILAMIIVGKEDRYIATFGSLIIGLFTAGTFYGLFDAWLILNTGGNIYSLLLLGFGFLVGVKAHYQFLVATAKSEVELKDFEFGGYPILAIVGQITLWFTLPIVVSIIINYAKLT